MAIIYILLGGIAAWILFKAMNKKSSKPQEVEIPIKFKVAYEIDDGDASSLQVSDQIDKDEWEGSFWEVTQPLPAKVQLRFKYTDGAGRKTERIVDVRQFGGFGSSALLIGHCHMRDATRTFRTDRIEACVDTETGELITNVQAYLQKKYDESPDKTADLLLEEEYDTLRILLYIGKADGQLRAPEKTVIKDTCIAITNDSRLTETTIDNLFSAMDVPTLQAFKLAVGRLAKRDSSAQNIVLATAEKIINTQKTVHPAEKEALDYMRKRFTDSQQGAA